MTSSHDSELLSSSLGSHRMLGWGLGLAAVAVSAIVWLVFSLAGNADGENAVRLTTVKRISFPVTLMEKGELQAQDSTEVKCEVEGKGITIIWIAEEGSRVKKGDLLVELSSDTIDDKIQDQELNEANAKTALTTATAELDIQQDKNASDIRKGELAVDLSEKALDKYFQGEWEESRQDAEIAIAEAETKLEQSEEEFDAAKELRAKEFITETEFEKISFDFKKAKWDLERAELSQKVLEKFTHKMKIAQAQSDVEEAKKDLLRTRTTADAQQAKKRGQLRAKKQELALINTHLTKLRDQKVKCSIYAPNPGIVVYGSGRATGHRGMGRGKGDQIKEGATVYERKLLITLPDITKMVVEAQIHESKLSMVAVGQPVTVRVEGLSDVVLTGRISHIAALSDSSSRYINPDMKQYETMIELDDHEVELKPGATAYAEILVGQVEDVLAVPVQSVVAGGDARYVFKKTESGIEPQEIVLGTTSNEWAEVKSGLSEGDEVVLSVTEDLKRTLSVRAPSVAPSSAPATDPNPGKSSDTVGFLPDSAPQRGSQVAEASSKSLPAKANQ